MSQVTLVSFYGHKTKAFQKLVQECSAIIEVSPLGDFYKPYHIDQIHGTIVGMEKISIYAEHYNANTWAATGTKSIMDFTQLIHILHNYLPLEIQIGGFQPSFDKFKSLGRSPYERSFQIQWQTQRVTLIGWPHFNGDFSSRRYLNELRNELNERCHLQHKYQKDNDLFMALGQIDLPPSMTEEELAKHKDISLLLENEIRDYLSKNRVDLTINAETISIAQYQVETLTPNSTIAYKITGSDINADFIGHLYE